MSANEKINERLWANLPTAPIPSLEEMKIAADFKRHWERGNYIGTPEQLAEMFYHKGRQDGRSAATKDILGKR